MGHKHFYGVAVVFTFPCLVIAFSNGIKHSAIACLTALALSGTTSAKLLDRGPDMVYDYVLNITWTRNANLPVSSYLSENEARGWATNLQVDGVIGWRLPYAAPVNEEGGAISAVDCATASELACRDNEMGYMYYHNLGGKLGDLKTNFQTAVGGQQLSGIRPVYWSQTEWPSYTFSPVSRTPSASTTATSRATK